MICMGCLIEWRWLQSVHGTVLEWDGDSGDGYNMGSDVMDFGDLQVIEESRWVTGWADRRWLIAVSGDCIQIVDEMEMELSFCSKLGLIRIEWRWNCLLGLYSLGISAIINSKNVVCWSLRPLGLILIGVLLEFSCSCYESWECMGNTDVAPEKKLDGWSYRWNKWYNLCVAET